MSITPGPWEWVEDRFRGGYRGIVGANGVEVLFSDCANDGDEGAAWFETFPSEDDRVAIGAVPELLAACKEAVADAARAVQPAARLPNYIAMQAAIAKAEPPITKGGDCRKRIYRKELSDAKEESKEESEGGHGESVEGKTIEADE